MTDEVARVEIDGLENAGLEIDGRENGRRTKNEGLTLVDWNLHNWKMTDWKMTYRLITAYKAGGGGNRANLLNEASALRHASRGLTPGHTADCSFSAQSVTLWGAHRVAETRRRGRKLR